MQFRSRKTIAALAAAAALAAVGAGTAVATSGNGDGAGPPDRGAVLADVAERLGVSEQALEDAFDAVAKEHGLPEGGVRHHGGGPGVDAAAEYLGLGVDDLMAQLEKGKTLAEVAEAQGKSVDGLVDALVADAREHIEALVNGELPAPPAMPDAPQ